MSHAGGPFFARLGNGVVRWRGAIVLLWVVITAILNLAVPQLEQVIAKSTTPVVPNDAQSVRALPEMDKRFGGPGANSIVFVVIADDKGLSRPDHRYYADLVHRLRAGTPGVVSVQDTLSRPELKATLTSPDGKAMYIPIGLKGENGSPETAAQVDALRHAAQQGRPEQLAVHVTGPVATFADTHTALESSLVPITAVTVVLITIILLVIYRSVITALIALTTIGISLGAGRAVTALCGLGVFDVSTFTGSFLTAVVLGAGTDYSVFLISQYHENRRSGEIPSSAIANGTRRVAAVITASAATVVVACAGMVMADVSLFRTTGPAIAVSVMVTLLAALTLSPALLSFAASRGYVEPRERGDALWRTISSAVTVRPMRVLVAGLVILGVLAAFYPGMRMSYDQAAVQPDDSDSNRGYATLADHFSPNEVLPDYVVINADHDMRNPRDLAALETAAAGVSKIAGVATVQGVTRPMGTPITEASLGYQAGQVGDGLRAARDRLAAGDPGRLSDGAQQLSAGTRRLAGGAERLAAGSEQLASGAGRAMAGANKLLAGMTQAQHGIGPAFDGANQAQDASDQLATGADQLAVGLEMARDQTRMAVDGLGLAYGALKTDPLCDVDPVCNKARNGIGEIYVGERDHLLPGLAQAASAARRIADGNTQLASGAAELRNGLSVARDGMTRLAEGQQLLRDRLGDLAAGAGTVADGNRQLADNLGAAANGADQFRDGTATVTASMQELERGLAQAADFLQRTGHQATDPAVGGFYLPAKAFNDPKMALARGMFMSQDGKTTRLLVQHSTDPMGREAMQRTTTITDTVQHSLQRTPLENSQVISTGIASFSKDLQDISSADFARFAMVALLAVFLILFLLLRGIVAPLYLLASVMLSYAAAMGFSVLVWQHLLGTDLDWSVPAITFVILVAMGADYNMLLMSRIREETVGGSRAGIARATTATGSVITAAGLIFAVSMFALMAGSVTTLTQIGFTIGVGILLDTFVVRTLVVPATAALLGRRNWWPTRLR